MAKIPKFKSLDQAAQFWDAHEFEDYVEDTEKVEVAVKIPRRKKILAIPLDLRVYERIETLASKRGISVDKLVAGWVKERALAGSK